MVLPRFIPVLLLSNGGLVKTVRFAKPTYVGDPINAVRIFNEKGVDEIVLLDIDATIQGREPDFRLIERIASEAFVPVTYGGGISSIEQMRTLFRLGVEKVCVTSAAIENPGLLSAAAAAFGAQSIVAGIDVKKDMLGRQRVYTRRGGKRHAIDPARCAQNLVAAGAGEVFLMSIERDGAMIGYDLPLIRRVADAVAVPVVACGGAGALADLEAAIVEAGASAAAAGSLFVFIGPYRAILINSPIDETFVARVYQRVGGLGLAGCDGESWALGGS